MESSETPVLYRGRTVPKDSTFDTRTVFTKILIIKSPLSVGLTKHTSCRIAYIPEGNTKMPSNLHVLGAAFSQPLVFSAAHGMSNVTDVRRPSVEVIIFTNIIFFFFLNLLCN